MGPATTDIRGNFDELRASTGNDTITHSSGEYSSITYFYLTTGGITATINGTTGTATVNKGSAGTDSIVDVDKPMSDGGYGFYGTKSDDVFNITHGDGLWMQVGGLAGNDRFNLQSDSGTVRIDYAGAPNGIDLDLRAGRAYDDGFGDTDTIIGHPQEIRGTDFKDVMRGSDRDETFIGRSGDDVIDGRGGFDRVRFDRSGHVIGLEVDLSEGRATGTSNGKLFTITLKDIERVQGSDSDDTFIGSPANEQFDGRKGDDTFIIARGGGEDSISDFTDGKDVLVLVGFGISKSDVLANAHEYDDGTNFGVWIDLRNWGGNTISLWNFRRANLDASDFLL